MAEFLTTVGIMCGAGSTFVVASFGYFCLRRRVCDSCCFCCEADVEVSDSPGRSVELTADNSAPVLIRERADSGWHRDWSVQLHRPRGSTNAIIRKIFSLPSKASLGQEWIGEPGQESKRPEYVAIPARMTQPLGEVELAKGQFSGDTAEHFDPIFRQSKIMSFKLAGSPPVSPHYLSSDVLRNGHSSEQTLNPILGSRGGAVSPHQAKNASSPSSRRGKARQNSPSPRKPASLSSLTSGTSVEDSVEGVRSPDLQHMQHLQYAFPDRTTEPIYTIHETCSSISSDSLMPDTNTHTRPLPDVHARLEPLGQNGHSMSYTNASAKVMHQSSPKLEDPTYRGFLQNFKIDHIS